MKVITIIAAAVAASVSSASPVPPPEERGRVSHVIGKVVRAPGPNPHFYSKENKQAWRLVLLGCLVGHHSGALTSDNCTDMIRITPTHVSPDAQDIKGFYDELTNLTQLEGTSTWLYMPGQPLPRPGPSQRSPGEEPEKRTIPPHGMPDRSHMSHRFDAGGFVKLSKKLHLPREEPNTPTIPPHGTPDRSHMSHRFDAEKPTIPSHGMPDRSHMSHRFEAEKPTIPPHGMPDRSHMSHRFDAGGWFVEPSKKLQIPRKKWYKMIELGRKNGGDVSSIFARGSNSPEAPGLATSSVDTASPVPQDGLAKECLQCTRMLCYLAPCQYPSVKFVDGLEKRAQEESANKEQKAEKK
ncbi:hypothetical protein C2857_007656 [Epichloe festucae Fl1]|uniref:Uncharacterized protein n=1 Tax=Epichloe festucae (strain Fl1) TaxID=877507 RepID=A0A7S9KQX2_EPIFF|nr:hypothetical protein C2857_007656 [Epichloe festucae Fl1]